MNHVRNLILAGFIIAVTLLVVPVSMAADNTPRRVIVGFKDNPGAEHRQLIESVGGRITYQYNIINAVAAEVPNRAVASLIANNKVAYVETVQHRQMEGHIVSGAIYDGSYEILPWGVNAVQADEVWDTDHNLVIDGPSSIAGQGVKVAVLDSGLEDPPPDAAHPDLAANVDFVHSYDLLDNDDDVSDIPGPVTGHGTSTSGIVAAVDNDIGVIGTAPRATIIMYRVCDSALNDCPDDAIIAALDRAVTDGAQVVSMSFGGIAFSIPFKQAIHAADQAGLVLVASAGNTPSQVAGARHYPSGFSEVISVGATDIDNNLASFSTFGGHQDLVAPGVATPTTTLQGQGRDNILTRNTAPSGVIDSNPMAFSGTGLVTSNLVFAGLGTVANFAAVDCSLVSGHQIALIERGAITFRAKVENAVAAGCIGAVIYNRPDLTGNFFGTLGVPQPIPAVSISTEDGLALKDSLAVGADVGVNVTLQVVALDYDAFSGTSASAPYVSGVAALVLNANPSLSNKDVTKILKGTAVDLGEPGRDTLFGFGLVNALGAVQCAQGVITCPVP